MELREFQRQLAAWTGTHNGSDRTEEELLAIIQENSTLPAREQRRIDRLRRKRQAGTLSGPEEKQLQALWSQVEVMNATRLEALVELSRHRGTDVKALMGQLGLPENRDAL